MRQLVLHKLGASMKHFVKDGARHGGEASDDEGETPVRTDRYPMTRRVREIMENPCKDRIGRMFPVKQDLLSRAWDSARETMGLLDDPEFVPHACRHTCASRLVQAGVDLYTVKEILGHSTIKVTERYAHLSPTMLQTAAQALEKPKVGVNFGDAERNSSPRR
jgi:integrase